MMYSFSALSNSGSEIEPEPSLSKNWKARRSPSGPEVSRDSIFSRISWLARSTLIVADVWQWTPFLFIIFVAALQSQDQEVEEAARLDGASWPAIF